MIKLILGLVLAMMVNNANGAEVTDNMKIKSETLQKAAELNKLLTDTNNVLDAMAKSTGVGLAVEAPNIRPPMIVFRPSDPDYKTMLDLAKKATEAKRDEAKAGLEKLGVTVEP